jgi:8-oxo-dGTP pyrophosphatase MutT (NUDIX family)
MTIIEGGFIELIARAVIQKENKILLAHKIGEPNTFLPGGHVEYGEYSNAALRRELREELGIEATIGEIIGILEYQYTDEDNNKHHEINFIYNAEINEKVLSKESHLEFLWCSLNYLVDKMLLPDPLPTLVTEHIETGQRFHCTEYRKTHTQHMIKHNQRFYPHASLTVI